MIHKVHLFIDQKCFVWNNQFLLITKTYIQSITDHRLLEYLEMPRIIKRSFGTLKTVSKLFNCPKQFKKRLFRKVQQLSTLKMKKVRDIDKAKRMNIDIILDKFASYGPPKVILNTRIDMKYFICVIKQS